MLEQIDNFASRFTEHKFHPRKGLHPRENVLQPRQSANTTPKMYQFPSDPEPHLSTSYKSTQSGSSTNIELECEEILDESYNSFEAMEGLHYSSVNSSELLRQFNISDELSSIEVSPCWKPESLEYIEGLQQKEYDYMINIYNLQTKQMFITPSMRAILISWMMEVCSEFTLKRETFYLSINYLDRYLATVPNVKKEEYQLIGICGMYIASKNEEIYSPRISDFAKSAANGYSVENIKSMEKTMLKKLNWKIFPGTAFNWLNWLMTQWDKFILYHFGNMPGNSQADFDLLPHDQRMAEKSALDQRMITFKQSNQFSYKRYRETLQLLDSACLDVAFVQFKPKYLAACTLYLALSKFFFKENYSLFKHFRKNEMNISLSFGNGKLEDFLLEPDADPYESALMLQDIYSNFLASTLSIYDWSDLQGVLNFLHPFLELEVPLELPSICKVQAKEKLEAHYEEFLAYQTFSPYSLEFVARKIKSQYNI